MSEEIPLSGAEQRRRSGAALFLKVHDLDAANAPEGSQRPVVRLCDLIISECLKTGAQELRILEPTADGAKVQYCRAGTWVDVMRVPAQAQFPLINRLKVMANLDIAKHPLQEGIIKVRLGGQLLELAIAVRLQQHAEEASVRMPPSTSMPTPTGSSAAT